MHPGKYILHDDYSLLNQGTCPGRGEDPLWVSWTLFSFWNDPRLLHKNVFFSSFLHLRPCGDVLHKLANKQVLHLKLVLVLVIRDIHWCAPRTDSELIQNINFQSPSHFKARVELQTCRRTLDRSTRPRTPPWPPACHTQTWSRS